MLINIVIIIGTHLIVPLLLIWGLWRGEFKSRTSWLATMLGSGAYTLYFFLAGAGWYWVSVYFRWAIPAVFLVATVVSLRRTWRADVPWWRNPGSPNGWALLATNAFLALLFGGVSLLAAQGYSYEDSRAVELSFPLRGGVWHVVHGGNGPMLNYHNVDPAQRFALDVVRLNPLGTRASGIYPSDPARYAAFGQKIYSPCAGEVIGTKAGQPDHRISGTDRENPAGNHVVVRCADEDLGVDVVLAHMTEGSVAVGEGQEVEEGQFLGRVGNSGNTSEPHLHIHAVRTGSGSILEGEGVPVLFDGRFPVRNGLVF